MPAGLIVRPAQAAEALALGQVGFDAWAASPLADLDAERTNRNALLKDFCDSCARIADRIVVAERDSAILGWGAREDGDDYISDLWVALSAQRQGIGTRLLAVLEGDIAKAGYGLARLETRFGNDPAVRFYERHGYRIAWRAEKFSSSLGYAIDKLGLEKPLTEVER